CLLRQESGCPTPPSRPSERPERASRYSHLREGGRADEGDGLENGALICAAGEAIRPAALLVESAQDALELYACWPESVAPARINRGCAMAPKRRAIKFDSTGS